MGDPVIHTKQTTIDTAFPDKGNRLASPDDTHDEETMPVLSSSQTLVSREHHKMAMDVAKSTLEDDSIVQDQPPATHLSTVHTISVSRSSQSSAPASPTREAHSAQVHDPMEVDSTQDSEDGHSTISPGRSHSNDADIVLDSTQASWSPFKRQKERRTRHRSDSPPLPIPKRKRGTPDEDEPPRKLRIPSPQTQKLTSTTSAGSSAAWRDRLAEFSSSGVELSQDIFNVEGVPTPPSRQRASVALSPLPLPEPSTKQHRMPETPPPPTSGDFIDLTALDDDDTPTLLSNESSSPEPVVEIVRTFISSDVSEVTIEFDLAKIQGAWQRALVELTDSEHARSLEPVAPEAGLANVDDGDGATTALSRIIDKIDFASMEVLGQFNLGFIVARRRKAVEERSETAEMDDLFIIDQHAADEKYNFETLQQTTLLEGQRLLRYVLLFSVTFEDNVESCCRPQPLELTASDELLAMEHLDVLRQNGFDVKLDESEGARVGSRLQLVAHPVSKSTVFTVRGTGFP